MHVIVTVPEKWDVMTRNTTTGGGVTDDSIQKLVQLIIIDEVHLLNEDRGVGLGRPFFLRVFRRYLAILQHFRSRGGPLHASLSFEQS